MPVMSNDYQRLVIDDLKTYGGLSRPVKANLLARLLTRYLPIGKLHPNPNDEFCNPAIGPSEEIIGKYVTRFRKKNSMESDSVQRECLTVEKLSTGGYMILNGHHRWLAAAKMGFKWMPVELVNPITEADILSTMARSDKEMCVSIDLDEVLQTDGKTSPMAKKMIFPLSIWYHRGLRRNAGLMIRELQKLGFDVWVYTGSYHSEGYFRTLFRLHGAKVNGIINGMKEHKRNENIRQAFRKKYRLSIHLDNDGVLWVNTRTKEYDSVNLDPQRDWANQAYDVIRGLDAVRGA